MHVNVRVQESVHASYSSLFFRSVQLIVNINYKNIYFFAHTHVHRANPFLKLKIMIYHMHMHIDLFNIDINATVLILSRVSDQALELVRMHVH
jgi:hypothetical protein